MSTNSACMELKNTAAVFTNMFSTNIFLVFCRSEMERGKVVAFLLLSLLFASYTSDVQSAFSSSWRDSYYVCVKNCAMCVKLWDSGLYNGVKCADRCSRHRGRRIVDPFCANIHFFNLDRRERLGLMKLRGKKSTPS